MNRNVLIIFGLCLIAIAVLTLFTYGPLQNLRSTHVINPASLQPTHTVQTSTGTTFSTYNNKDRPENYYSINLPAQSHVTAGVNPGSYAVTFQSGDATVELMDIPDNSTPELLVLSQEEPKLKKSLQNYKRLDYKKLTVNGSEGYQILYGHTLNGVQTETMRTYVTGKDMANVTTFSAPLSIFPQLQSLFTTVLQSFHWATK